MSEVRFSTGRGAGCPPHSLISDVPAPAWPESPGFGLALGSSGLAKSEAKPKAKCRAWPGLALAQGFTTYLIHKLF